MELNKVAESIGAINTPSVGIAGEVRCVITGVDGEVKTDTGYQKNLILNQGLDFFGGDKGTAINAYCAIGSGNSAPAITQTQLDTYIAQALGADITSSYSYVDKGDNLYRMWEQRKYRFTGLSNVNISEVGLVSTGTSSSNYYLTTRALIKDSLGAPTTITIKTGETLDIYYKIHKVIDTRDKSFVVNVLDGNGGAVPYNVVVRLKDVGGASNSPMIAAPVATNVSQYAFVAYAGEIGLITGSPAGSHMGAMGNISTDSVYVGSSYKRLGTYNLPLSNFNGSIRAVTMGTFIGQWQIRFGRVSDDAPLTKTANDTLEIPLEFNWGRYEGDL